jgi:hypothetical protein
MKKSVFVTALMCLAFFASAAEPVFYESFNKCLDAEDENYGYTGGNDNQWGGDIAKAYVIYTDNFTWDYSNANGAYQCVKVGISNKAGSLTTPAIACAGDVTLTFRAAPWAGDEDTIINIMVNGGTPEQSAFKLHKNKWNDFSVKINDVTSQIKVSFLTYTKNRFFIDEVKVFPADPNAAAIRVPDGLNVDFGFLGKNYAAMSRTIQVTGENISSAGIAVSIENDAHNLFTVTPATLPAEGGSVTIGCKAGASVDMHRAYLKLKGNGAKIAGEKVEKTVILFMEVSSLNLVGSGTKEDPYTVADRLKLTEGTVWSNTLYWVTGYVLGGAYRSSSNQFMKISTPENDDKYSVVLADSPSETDMNKIVVVQIGHDARTALNIVDNPELIGKQIKVQGWLLYQKDGKASITDLYLGKPCVRNVNTHSQYVRPDKDPTAIVDVPQISLTGRIVNILGQPVDENYKGIVIQNGRKYLRQ